jgi:hypothetical protein
MMNRAQKRQMDKMLKSKLTPEQFAELKNEATEEKVKLEVDRFIGNFVKVFKPAMRENKISDTRADKIIEDVFYKAQKNYSMGEQGEPKPDDKYLSYERIISAAERVLLRHGIGNSDTICKELYEEFMKEGEGANA